MGEQPTISVQHFDDLCQQVRCVSTGPPLNDRECFEEALRICTMLGLGVIVKGQGDADCLMEVGEKKEKETPYPS